MEAKEYLEKWSNMSDAEKIEKLQQELQRTQLMLKDVCKITDQLLSHYHQGGKVLIDIDATTDFWGEFKVYEPDKT